jgi:hypothetical protein
MCVLSLLMRSASYRRTSWYTRRGEMQPSASQAASLVESLAPSRPARDHTADFNRTLM